MKEIHVVDQAGSAGFVSPSDRRGFELHPQAWTGMNAVRMDEGGVEPGWGYTGTGISLPDDAHSLDYMVNTVGDENWYVVGSDKTIDIYYVETGASAYATRTIGDNGGTEYSGFYDAGDTWVTAHKDGHMVMTNGKDRPQMILQTATRAAAVAADLAGFDTPPSLSQDTYIACKTIIAFRGFLVAGGITYQTKGPAGQVVAWSDRTDTGSLPGTWDYADPATLAGNVTLPANYGDIIALKEIRDELMIYCERGAYRMQWVGGQFVFRIVPAYDTIGCLNPRSLCSSKGTNIIVTYTDIVRTDGQYPVSIANGTVRKELFEQLSPANAHKVQVVEYPKKSEVVIICPDKQDDLWCGKQLVYNWSSETWVVRHGLLMRAMANLPKLISAIDPDNTTANSNYDEIWAGDPNHVGTAPPADEVLPPGGDNITSMPSDQETDNYSVVSATFGTLLADEGVLYMFGIATKPNPEFPTIALDAVSNSIWQYDGLDNSYNHSADLWIAPFVERRGINLTNDETYQIVTAVYPKMEGSGSVDITMGVVDYIGGQPADIEWDHPVRFTPESMYRITCRTAGRRHAIRFQAVKTGAQDSNSYSNFRLTGYDIEYSQMGRR